MIRHLDRVAAHLPADPSRLQPTTAATDTVVLHGYGSLDLRRVQVIARDGPADLRAFLAALRDRA